MKTLLVLAAAAALGGCAVYPAPYDAYGGVGYGGAGYGGSPVVVQTPPVYVYGSGGYRYSTPPPPAPRPYAYPRYRTDRDRDGVPNRFDRYPYDSNRR
ncbi:MAG: hypothetical protein V4731_04740 [Pseudomonadota bacterium]